MRWNDRNSDYAKEKREEDRDLEWKEDHVVGWDRWSLACLGAGGEDKLIAELNQERIEETERKIRKLERRLSTIVEDPKELYLEVEEYREKVRLLREKHTERFYNHGKLINEYIYEDRFERELFKLMDETEMLNIKKKLEEYERKDIYIKELDDLYAARGSFKN